MQERELEDMLAVLPPLLSSLDALGFLARHLTPGTFGEAAAAIGRPQDGLRLALPRLQAWPEALAGARAALEGAGAETLAAFDELDALLSDGGDLRGVYRALRHAPRAQEALWPLASGLAPVSRFFLPPDQRGDEALLERLAAGAEREDVGLAHVDEGPGSRGGFSLYVPETYTPERAAPLIFALHGGGGNGRSFVWSWLREARGRGAILVAPTAVGDTWAIAGEDADTPNLNRILAFVRARWTVDADRLLLTGMSDGGTFSYVSGLEPGSPFTHLAPVAAAFHPMLAGMADAERLAGLPIHIVHGVHDWMFPVSMAQEAAQTLAAAGAAVTYREIGDLSHTYPREMNSEILDWLDLTLRR